MERLLTPSEASQLLGVSVATIYTWVYRRQVPFQKVGRALRFAPSALEAWLAAQAWQPSGAPATFSDRPRGQK